MAKQPFVNFAGPSYHLDDKKAAVQSSINTNLTRTDGVNTIMVSSPGEVTVATVGGPTRGSRTIATAERMFWVGGQTLYEVLGDYSTVARGTLASSSGYVGMADNKTQLALVDGADLYIFNLATNTLTQITSPGWRGSNDVYELDGYFIFVDPNTDQFYLSAIDDGSDLNALDFSSADSAPDNIVSHIVSHRQAWFFGSLSTEIWIDSGNSAFPFVRYQSYTLDVGCVGQRAVIRAADTLFWIGRTRAGIGIVYMAVGNQPQRVSTTAIEEVLRASSDISAAEMWTYQTEGHEFIAINAPGLSTTWVYDAAFQEWHEVAEWSDGWQPQRSRLFVMFQGQHIGGDSDGNLVRLDTSVNNRSGRPIVRERTWPAFVGATLDPTSFLGLEVSMKTGYGGNVTLQISNDGGYNFLGPLARTLGATGRWMQRVRWNSLGTSFNRVFRLRCSDDVPWTIYSAVIDTP